MTKTTFMDNYPVLSVELAKEDIDFKNVTEILDFFKEKIENDPIAKFITNFNHYEHTQSVENNIIEPQMLDAQNIIFCFGQKIPNALVLAVRPRTIGVVEYEKKFVISLMEAPNAPMTDKMESWVKELSN